MEGSCKLKARRATNSNEPRSDDSSAILYYINFVDASFCFAVSLSIGEEELEGIFFCLDGNLNISFKIDISIHASFVVGI